MDMLEDVLKIKTRWGKAILSRLISATLKKAGYDMSIDLEDLEMINVQDSDVVAAKVTARVSATKSAISRMI